MTIAPHSAERRATDLKFSSLVAQQEQHAAAVKACGRLKGKTMIDVGCGFGDLLHSLPTDVNYIGVEIDEDKLDACRRVWPNHDFRHVDEEWAGDVVVSVAVLQCVPVMAAALERWWAAAGERMVVVSLQPWAYRNAETEKEAVTCWVPYDRKVTATGRDWECSRVIRR